MQRGPLDRHCAIRNLSERGAPVALDPLIPVESRITLRFGAGDASLSLRAKVTWSPECAEEQPPERSPAMGVRFDDIDPEARSDGTAPAGRS